MDIEARDHDIDDGPIGGTPSPTPDSPHHDHIEIILSPYTSIPDPENYEDIHSNVVEYLVDEVAAEDGTPWYQAVFRDGRHNMVSLEELQELPNGPLALSVLQGSLSTDSNASAGVGLRARRTRSLNYVGQGSDVSSSDDDDVSSVSESVTRIPQSTLFSRSSSRRPSNNSAQIATSARTLRPRKLTSLVPQVRKMHGDDSDELAGNPAQQSSDDDDDFQLVQSDLLSRPGRPSKRRRKLMRKRQQVEKNREGDRGSSIEFEAPRRSERSTRNRKSMRDSSTMNLDTFIDGDKTPPVPKTVLTKEVFKPISQYSDFAKAHSHVCTSCRSTVQEGRGSIIYCQGCSFSYHQGCLGTRHGREHRVTKIGEGDFVLQCRFCVAGKSSKDEATRPDQAMCQSCRKPGAASAAFSPYRTAKQEEKLREQNDGVDPATQVDPALLNKPDIVLFRCFLCKRAWHWKHLPTSSIVESDVADAESMRYKTSWKCNECTDCESKSSEVDKLVAWRPADHITGRVEYSQVAADNMEYLVKWKSESFFHCRWMPGAWIWGTTSSLSRIAFERQAAARQDLLCYSKEDAIPENYLLADVLLDVTFRGNLRTRDIAKSHIDDVKRVYVKFQGLGYEDAVWDSPPPKDSRYYKAFRAAFDDYVGRVHFNPDSLSKIKERDWMFKDLDFKTKVELSEQPKNLRGKLMKYQLQGVNWMLHRYHQNQNAILADEMGLGKTIQVIALLSTLVLEQPRCWPFLVIVPNSTCANWRREIQQWAPELRVAAYYGGRTSQDLSYTYELFPNGRQEIMAHVVVMSYEAAQDRRNPVTFLKKVHWAGLVVDEGQRLKNDANILYQALTSLRIPYRLLLTGTPLQNNKRELFNLLQFVDSKYNAEELDSKYQELTSDKVRELHDIISPYFYRRTKSNVLKFLPDMVQLIVPVTMSVLQEKLCRSIMSKNPMLIKSLFTNKKLKASERGSLNNILSQLRKCLCHPFIYSDAIEERVESSAVSHRNLMEASSKLSLLEVMLPKLKERGHRLLIFTQFLGQLTILEDFMAGMGLKYIRLDGTMSSLEKQKRIDEFNKPDSPVFAFLLSTRAGGVGINLATADTVIIMDPDFNPHQDAQAFSRAHRIGQTKKVLCFQLMTRNSAEEKIMQIGKKKMALDHVLIDQMDADEDAGQDLESILKFGAEALFSEDNKERNVYDSAAVDRLLDRAETEAPCEGDKLTFARVWANEKGLVEDNPELEEHEAPAAPSQSVWDSILAEREAIAKQEEEERNREKLGRGGRKRHKINYRTNMAMDGLAGANDGFASSDNEDDDFSKKDSGSESEGSASHDKIQEDPLIPKNRGKRGTTVVVQEPPARTSAQAPGAPGVAPVVKRRGRRPKIPPAPPVPRPSASGHPDPPLNPTQRLPSLATPHPAVAPLPTTTTRYMAAPLPTATHTNGVVHPAIIAQYNQQIHPPQTHEMLMTRMGTNVFLYPHIPQQARAPQMNPSAHPLHAYPNGHISQPAVAPQMNPPVQQWAAHPQPAIPRPANSPKTMPPSSQPNPQYQFSTGQLRLRLDELRQRFRSTTEEQERVRLQTFMKVISEELGRRK